MSRAQGIKGPLWRSAHIWLSPIMLAVLSQPTSSENRELEQIALAQNSSLLVEYMSAPAARYGVSLYGSGASSVAVVATPGVKPSLRQYASLDPAAAYSALRAVWQVRASGRQPETSSSQFPSIRLRLTYPRVNRQSKTARRISRRMHSMLMQSKQQPSTGLYDMVFDDNASLVAAISFASSRKTADDGALSATGLTEAQPGDGTDNSPAVENVAKVETTPAVENVAKLETAPADETAAKLKTASIGSSVTQEQPHSGDRNADNKTARLADPTVTSSIRSAHVVPTEPGIKQRSKTVAERSVAAMIVPELRVALATQETPNSADSAGALPKTPDEQISLRSIYCLAQAVYFEARNEPRAGQLAVAQVVLNRVNHRFYPDSICAVVFQNQNRRHKCQFSFACDGRSDQAQEKRSWQRAMRLATDVLENGLRSTIIGPKVTHYHATYVRPNWIRDMVRIRRIGRHIFYRVRRWS